MKTPPCKKFISLGNHEFIPPFGEYLDIKYSASISEVLNSDRTFLGWNWYLQPNLKIFSHRKKAGLPFFCMERGALPGSLFFDPNGFNFSSSSYSRSNWDKSLSGKEALIISKYTEAFKRDNKSLESQSSSISSENPFLSFVSNFLKFDRVAFVPLQLHDDSVIGYFSGWSKDLGSFIKNITTLAGNNKNILFLYKNHPLSKCASGSSENLICVDNFHFKDCINYSDLVITINSGIGLQSMIYGKPVLICGDAFYEFNDINIKTQNLNDLQASLSTDLTPNRESIFRFLYWLNFKFYSNVKWHSIPNVNASKLLNIERLTIWDGKRSHTYKDEDLK
jgi:hypothetical protein